ncbi:hypothetical protein V6N13_084973 [Hibiscus sabdariffa]
MNNILSLPFNLNQYSIPHAEFLAENVVTKTTKQSTIKLISTLDLLTNSKSFCCPLILLHHPVFQGFLEVIYVC